MPPPVAKGKEKAVEPAQASSIDDIFALSSKTSLPPTSSSKASKRPHPEPISSSSGAGTGTVETSKKKKKKRKAQADDANMTDDQAVAQGRNQQRDRANGVETIVDPSTVKLKADTKEGKKRSKKDSEEDEAFRDTRGTRRKTEEGFLIYKEAELGINPEAGGTPLCPFDCDCCF